MKFETYAKNCIPTKWTILGLTLKSLSLGHYILMRRLGCRYASDENTEVDIGDLILGVLICSMSYEEFLEFMDDKNFTKEIAKWGKHCKKKIKKDKNFNLFEKFVMFRKYLNEGIETPLYWEGENAQGKSSGCHWALNLHNVLVGELGFTNTETLNMPLTLAFSHFFRYLESNGVIELMKDDEENLVAQGETHGQT